MFNMQIRYIQTPCRLAFVHDGQWTLVSKKRDMHANILFNDCPSLVYTMIHIKFYRLKFHGGVSVMASIKHYVVLAMLKAGVAAASEGMPCLLKRWLSGPAQSVHTLHKPGTPNTILESFIPWHCCTSGKMRM